MRSISKRWLPPLLVLLTGITLLSTSSWAAGPLPRAPREGLSYLERAFLPEPVPEGSSFAPSTSSSSDSPALESSPADFLAGTSFKWTSMSPPDGRSTHTAVYDPLQDRVLVFGGRRIDGGWSLFNDCWEFRTTPAPHWNYLAASGTPPIGRAGATAIFDPVGNRMLMWGGDDFTSETPPFREVWSLNLSSTPTWVKLSPTGTPPLATFCARAVYDPVGRRVLVFGGLYEGNVVSGDVWELRLAPMLAWQKITPTNVGPAPRFWHTAVLDEQRRRMLVYGGIAETPFGDVWSLAITDSTLTWEQLFPAGTPPGPRYAHVAAFDAVRDRMVVTSGVSSTSYLTDSWALEFDPDPRWVQLTPADEVNLVPRTSSAGVLLPGSDSLILFGGYLYAGLDIYLNDTWRLTLTPGEERWAVAIDGNEPDPYWLGRLDHSAVLDASSNRMIIFGGLSTGGERSDTWVLPLDDLDAPPRWTEVIPQETALPRARMGHTAIFDRAVHRMVVFGGGRDGVSAPYADCWQLDFGVVPPRWTQFTFSGATPPARWYHTAVFDPKRRQMLVFGGSTKTQYLNDLWALDLNGAPAWTQLTPSGALPNSRSMCSLVLDEKNDRIILFGGDAQNYQQDYNDVWALSLADPTHWDLVMAGGSSLSIPDQRFSHVAAYDTLNDRMLMYGGCASNQIDFWSFSDQLGPPHWTQLAVPGGPPMQRCGRAAVLDQVRGAWILYGGAGVNAASNTLWNLQWGVPVPVQITFASVRRDDDCIVLEWRTSESNQGAFYVDRELPGQPRARISRAVPSTSTGYSFLDPSDPPIGTNYYLQLLDRAGGATTFGPYELQNGPGVHGVAPQLVATPNPFRSSMNLTARGLPAGDLSIEVCSVAGRVVHREPPIVWFAGGDTQLQIPDLDALPPGIYFVRLRVGDEVLSARLLKLPSR